VTEGTAPGTGIKIPVTRTPVGYSFGRDVLVAPGGAEVVRLRRNDILQIIDVRGQQAADVMAWMVDAPDEYLSPGHTISCLTHLVPKQGECFYSNHRRPLLRVERDTVGRHDLVVPCCDPERYSRDFHLTDHGSCLSSIQAALGAAGERFEARAEMAWNAFMNNELLADGSIVTHEPEHGPGDHVELLALEDLAVAVTSCPQDQTACNAWNITEIGLRVFGPTP